MLYEWDCLVYTGARIGAVHSVMYTVTLLKLCFLNKLLCILWLATVSTVSWEQTLFLPIWKKGNIHEQTVPWTHYRWRWGDATVLTLRHTTECSLVRSTKLASILPAKTNGNASRNPYYHSKVIELLLRVCVGLELPFFPPPTQPNPPCFFAFYTYCLRHYAHDTFLWVRNRSYAEYPFCSICVHIS